MRERYKSITQTFVLLGFAIAGTGSRSGAQQPARDTTVAEARRQINTLRQRYVNAMRNKDSAGLGASVSETFVLARRGLNPPDGTNPTVVGRAAFVGEFQKKVFEALPAGVNPWVQYPLETDIKGDWAFEVGDFGPDGGPHIGRYIWVVRREADGSWRIAYETFAKPQ